MASTLAAQEAWWEPGTRSGYHSITFGYLLGELVRRITGRTLGTFFREEVAVPLGADFHIGLAEESSTAVMDLDARLAYSYVMNRMVNELTGDPRSTELADALHGSL
jgi:CubicO group peptidase (beta-lactamase class C family)